MNATVADTIYDTLSQQIITGDLTPGEKLRQDHIARRFETSHVPVREALLRLEARGLAKSEPRRGMRVSELNPAEVREVVEMRVALEVLAMQHAAVRATPSDILAADTVRKSCDAAQSMAQWEQRNRDFHMAILKPCAMPRLLHAIDDLHIASARHLFANWQHRWSQRVDQDHATIVQAMKRRDAATATEALRRHLRRVQ